MRILGVDPGVHGAVALLHDDRLVALCDMPVTGSLVNIQRLRQLIVEFDDNYALIDLIVIEEQPFMPSEYGQFVKGRNFGRVEGAIGSLGHESTSVRPQVWKKHHGLIKQPKQASRDLALELWPHASGLLARVKDTDRAEAALIARWAWDTRDAA